MNASQAYTFGQKNITEMVVPYWSLGPYYAVSVSPQTITVKLDPPWLLAKWDEIFPFHTWQYYPELNAYTALSSGTTQLLELMATHSNFFVLGWTAPPATYQVAIKDGYVFNPMPDISTMGFSLPLYYPWNIPQVRQAIAYVINRTEATLAWGPPPYAYYPVWVLAPIPAPNVVPGLYLTIPESIRSVIVNYTVNWTYASQLLESAGLYYKNGQWYLPNGTPLTLTLYTDGRTDWLTISSEIAAQLGKFGIPTKLISVEAATYYTEESSCQLPDSVDFVYAGLNKGGYDTFWVYLTAAQWNAYTLFPGGWCAPGTVTPFAFPIVQNNQITGWYCKPVTTNLPIPNNTIVWCVNSTFGYINLTNWENAIAAVEPGSAEYGELVKVFYSWFEYWVPAIQIGIEAIAQGAVPKYVDMGWLMKCIPFNVSKYTEAAYTLEYPHGMSGASFDTIDLVFLGGFAPQGVVPPLAEAIINGSLWTKTPQFAAFIGLPTPDPELQACVASYFHTTYTPVTTSTTTTTTTPVTTTTTSTTTTTTTTTAVSTVTSTATVTSTVTSTSVSTTTAVTTVTVTKPIISTALIAGIVIIVIVVAAVAALIALRRR